MMKKRMLALLLACLMLGLTACSGGASLLTGESATGETAGSTAETDTGNNGSRNAAGFCTGVGRADITPDFSVPLAGLGNTSYRMSEQVLDKVYATCVAIRDEDGETLLLFNLDIIRAEKEFADQIRKIAASAAGTDRDHVLMNCTHTHSAPDPSSTEGVISQWKVLVYKAVKQAALDAVADLDASRVFVGTAQTENQNFVRRMYKTNGFISANTDYGTGEITRYESEVDPEMRIIRFVRENAEDIVLASWQAHPTLTMMPNGVTEKNISSDAIGAWRSCAESELGVRFAFFQGGAGNVNMTTKMPSDKGKYTTDYEEAGRKLCAVMEQALGGLTEIPAGKVRAVTTTLEAPYQHGDEDKIPQCQEIMTYWEKNQRKEAQALCDKYGISSGYEAAAIIARATRPATGELELTCYAFGDVAITAAPFERFCQTEKEVRERSPFAFTFALSYSNDFQKYLPAAECWANKGYEVVVSRFDKGTAELITQRQLEMLNDLKAAG